MNKFLLIVAISALALSTRCLAEEPLQSTVAEHRLIDSPDRYYWQHKGGHFEHTEGNRWLERSQDGIFHFVEVRRSPRWVELFDRGRNMTVRLYDDVCELRIADGNVKTLYHGRWERR